MNAAAVSHAQPIVSFWNKGKRPEDQGWTFDRVSLSLSDLASSRSFTDLQKKGVPVSVCDAAKRAGFMPSELGEYLEENA